ncbi:MAG TPA: FecR family protein [Bacteroidales bacterium]|jgi:ferric-dicitrate binding protein FerR (iron transport regulator)|nr:FecR family protein [Bacteroidales bacterium]
MHYSELKLLLVRYRENRCSSEEIKKLQAYFSDKWNESQIKDSLLENLENFKFEKNEVTDIVSNDLFKSITFRISDIAKSSGIEDEPASVKERFIYRILKIAAVLIPVFLLGGILSYILFNKVPEKGLVTFNEIKAPYGARSEILLPDGTSVWLNAGSKIKYMSVFNIENREVYLEGEAYFKVAKNKSIPFNVRTGDLNIQAIGTEFNVKSYADEGIIETTLVEGKISIRQTIDRQTSDLIYLEPHQKAFYYKEKNQVSVENMKTIQITKPQVIRRKPGVLYIDEKVDPVPIVAWKENRLILKGEELSSLVIKLERKYDVHFMFESEDIRNFRFTGTLEDETLTQVLDVIKLSAPIEYRLEGKTVRILENKQMKEKFSTHLKKK